MSKTVGPENRPPHVKSAPLAAIQQQEWELDRMKADLERMQNDTANYRKDLIRDKRQDIRTAEQRLAELKAKQG